MHGDETEVNLNVKKKGCKSMSEGPSELLSSLCVTVSALYSSTPLHGGKYCTCTILHYIYLKVGITSDQYFTIKKHMIKYNRLLNIKTVAPNLCLVGGPCFVSVSC